MDDQPSRPTTIQHPAPAQGWMSYWAADDESKRREAFSMVWDGLGWSGIVWDSLGWFGMVWDAMGCDGMRWPIRRIS